MIGTRGRFGCTGPLLGLLLLHLVASALHAASPQVSTTVPRGGQRGTDVAVQIYGARLEDAAGLFFHRSGLQVLEVKPERANRCSVRLRIAKDCPPGEHPVCLRTRSGISNLFTFHVGSLPEVREKEPNNTFETAQPLRLDTTMNGVIRPEDVDRFTVTLPAEKTVHFEVQGVRLGGVDFDPHLTVFDAAGNSLLVVDDTSFGRMDPVGSLRMAEDTPVTIEVREAAYGGSNRSLYRLSVGSFPRPLGVFPAGAKPGESVEIRHLADSGDGVVETVTVPEGAVGIHSHFPEVDGKIAPTPVPLVVSGLPRQVEPASGAGVVPADAPKLGPWSLIGPFDNGKMVEGRGEGHDIVYPPEKEIDLSASYPGKGGMVRWSSRPEFRDGAVHSFVRILPESDWTLVYLVRDIESPVEQTVTALMSSDDTMKVWLNGALVHEHKGHRGVVVDSDVVPLTLKPGTNRLLLKVANGTGGFGFTFRLAPPGLEQAVACKVPVALHGRLARPGEVDTYRFSARKGQSIDLRVRARELRSPLDSVIEVLRQNGARIGRSDDTAGRPDSRIRFRSPDDGEFLVTIRDQLRRGGPRFTYCLEMFPTRRVMSTRVAVPGRPRDLTVSVPVGGRMATVVRGDGVDPRDEVRLSFGGLPAGVTAETVPYVRQSPLVPVLLRAEPEAVIAGGLVRVGAGSLKDEKKTIDAGFAQTVPLLIVENNRTYLETTVDRVPVAVIEPVPLAVDLVPPAVPLVRSSPMGLEVRITRADGFDAPVRVRMLWNPPGVGSGAITIPEGKSVGRLPLNANRNAALRTWKIAVVAEADRNGRFAVSSELVDLTVSDSWVTAKIGKSRVEQGNSTRLTVQLSKKREYPGGFAAEILNLPGGVKTTFPTVAPDTKKLTFDLQVDPKARPGRHRNLLLRFRIPTETGEVVHHFRGGEIRIDRPLPPGRKKPKPESKKKDDKEAGTPEGRGTLARPKT